MEGENLMHPLRAPRLVDIARAVGVHPSVVSRTLSNDPTLSIRPETRTQIVETANKLGYRANSVARALRASSVGAAAIVMPSLRNPVWAEIVRGALAEAVRRDTAVLLAEVPDEFGNDAEYIRLVEEGRIDGLLLGNSEPAERRGDWPPTAVPCVHVNRAVSGAACNVVMDEGKAMGLVIEHFLALGHRRIGLVDGPKTIDTTRRRTNALRTLAKTEGFTATVVNEAFDERGGYLGIQRLLSMLAARRPTAIAVASLTQVVGALSALRRGGWSVPQDVSIASFDDDPLMDYLEVEVTGVRMPLFELGEAAMHALLDRLAGAKPVSVEIDSPMSLALRSSTAPPKRT